MFYSGWVTVASIANVSSYLVKIGWDGFGISAVGWTIVMIVVALVINLIVTWTRNMREFALVGAWALIAIAYANWELETTVSYVSALAALVLIVSSMWHGFQNRDTSPTVKWKEYFTK